MGRDRAGDTFLALPAPALIEVDSVRKLKGDDRMAERGPVGDTDRISRWCVGDTGRLLRDALANESCCKVLEDEAIPAGEEDTDVPISLPRSDNSVEEVGDDEGDGGAERRRSFA